MVKVGVTSLFIKETSTMKICVLTLLKKVRWGTCYSCCLTTGLPTLGQWGAHRATQPSMTWKFPIGWLLFLHQSFNFEKCFANINSNFIRYPRLYWRSSQPSFCGEVGLKFWLSIPTSPEKNVCSIITIIICTLHCTIMIIWWPIWSI